MLPAYRVQNLEFRTIKYHMNMAVEQTEREKRIKLKGAIYMLLSW